MGRRVSNHDVPHLSPVKRIELSEKNLRLRLIGIIILFGFGMGAIIFSINSLITENNGWKEIKADTSAKANCSDEFVFQYYLGAGEASATAEYKAISMLYTQAVVEAYQLFHNSETFDDVISVGYINQHPNEEIEISPVLYDAFETIQKYNNRNIYLGPLYLSYQDVYQSKDDSEAVNFDINRNEDLASYYSQIISYANDDSKIRLQLLGNNKICLYVADDYLDFAKENQESNFIDFAWMKNAFIIDYIASIMQERNFCFGSISSCDGFVRNLDTSENKYAYNIFDCENNTVYSAGIMEYSNGISLVYMKNYLMNNQDQSSYYEYCDGTVVTPYIDIADGLPKNALNNMVCYSHDKNCSEVLMEMIPVYVNSEFENTSVEQLKSNGVYSVYCENYTIKYNDSNLNVSDLFDKDGVTYRAELLTK